jgi:sigma-E factor negative regulatory protein RseA
MMTQQISTPNELVSALTDGELRGEAFVKSVQWLEESEEARASWHTYHLVGDVLRSGEMAATGAHDAAFVARLRSRLQGEVQLVQTERAIDFEVSDTRQERVGDLNHHEVANDASFRWKLVAGFASVAAVTVVGWQLVAGVNAPSGAPQLARVEVRTAERQAQVMIRDPQLDQLLAAHQQSGGISALQMPAGFLRNATYDRPAR